MTTSSVSTDNAATVADIYAAFGRGDVQAVLDRLTSPHRAALTLRYLDDLPVPEVAALLGRTVHATEALLVRARTAFRTTYEATESPGGAS